MSSLKQWLKNQYISWRYAIEFQRILAMQPGARFLRMKQLGFDLAENTESRQVYRHTSGAEVIFIE